MTPTTYAAPTGFALMPAFVATPSNLPVPATKTILDIVQGLPKVPLSAPPQPSVMRQFTGLLTKTAGIPLVVLGSTVAAACVADLLGCPPIPPIWKHHIVAPFHTMTTGLFTAMVGGLLWYAGAPGKKVSPKVRSERVASLAQSLPLPAYGAPIEQQAVTVWLARKLIRSVHARRLSPEAARYAVRVRELYASVDTETMSSVASVLRFLFDESGQPRSTIDEIEWFTATVQALEPDLRERLIGYLRPQIDIVLPIRATWRLRALDDALAGKPFRYGALVATESGEPTVGTPERIRIDALDTQIQGQLQATAAADNDTLHAHVAVPSAVALDHVYRLAGKYEGLGYRAFLHRDEKKTLRLTLCTSNAVPCAGYIEGRGAFEDVSKRPGHEVDPDFTTWAGPQ